MDIVLVPLVRGLVYIIEHLPDRVSFAVARACVGVLVTLARRSRGVGRRNLEMAFPEKSAAEREAILERSLDYLAYNIQRYARFPSLTPEFARSHYDYEIISPLLQQAREECPDVGLIFATMHFGVFEELVQVQAVLGGPVAILARGFGRKRLDEFWNSRRELHGNFVFGRTGGYREMAAQLSAGTDIAVLFDQNVKANHAVFTDFFGRPAATTKSLAVAALRTGAPIMFSVAGEVSPGHFEIVHERIPVVTEGLTPDEQIFQITAKLNAAAERAIRRFPDHWFWIHRRWKTRPPGEGEDLYKGI